MQKLIMITTAKIQLWLNLEVFQVLVKFHWLLLMLNLELMKEHFGKQSTTNSKKMIK